MGSTSGNPIKMAIICVNQAIEKVDLKEPIPLIITVPDEFESDYYVPHDMFIK